MQRLSLASPSSCPSSPNQKNRSVEQNSYSLRRLTYVNYWLFFFSTFLCFFPFRTISMLAFFYIYVYIYIYYFYSYIYIFFMAWATDTALRSLFYKTSHSFSLALSGIWFPVSTSFFRLSSFPLKMLSLKQL